MNDVIREWVAKANGDFRTAKREIAAVEAPNFDAACFHAQQCIEKLMKALLISYSELPPKTHDLVVLADLLSGHIGNWKWAAEELRFLSRAAVAFRYPGESAERQDAIEAVAIAERLREALLVHISPPPTATTSPP